MQYRGPLCSFYQKALIAPKNKPELPPPMNYQPVCSNELSLLGMKILTNRDQDLELTESRNYQYFLWIDTFV